MQEMHPQRTGDFLYLYMYQPQLERMNVERVLEPLTEKTQSQSFSYPYSGSFHRGEHALAWRSQSRDR